MLYQPIEQLCYTAWSLEGAAAGMIRCFEILDREPETRDAAGAQNLPPVKGRSSIEASPSATRPSGASSRTSTCASSPARP